VSPPEPAWLVSRPPPRLAGEGVRLEQALTRDEADLVEAVNDSLEHLGRWMPWAQAPATAQSISTFLVQAQADWNAGVAFQYLLRDAASAEIIGCAGLHASVGRARWRSGTG